MKIETKYNIGDKVWIVYEPQVGNTEKGFELAEELSVFIDTIAEIVFYKNGLRYSCEYYFDELKEEDIILYEEKEKLLARIEELTNRIEERE